MSIVMNILRFAARRLSSTPGFAIVAVGTIAVAVGATAAIFSVAYGVLLRPLPYRDADALVLVRAEREASGRTRVTSFSPTELDAWLGRARAFEGLAMSAADSFAVTTGAGVEEVGGAHVSDAFFSVLGAPLAIGRALGDDAEPVAVISHRLWQKHYAADPRALGRPITINGRPYTIVGVASPEFRFPSERTDIWTPMAFARLLGAPAWINDRNSGGAQIVARLNRGMTPARALDDAARVMRSMADELPESRRSLRPRVVPLRDHLTGAISRVLLTLCAAVGLVLLIACANVVSLLLARQASDVRQRAIREALGEPRSQAILHGFAESVLIAAVGGVLGIFIAQASIRALRWLQPAQLPRLDAIHVDAPVLLFTLGVIATTALLCGALPAIRAVRRDASPALTVVVRSHTGIAATRRLMSSVVTIQLAISIVLLVTAALFGRSLSRLMHTDIGIRPDNLMTVQLDLSLGRTLTDEQQIALIDALRARVGAIPSLQAFGFGAGLPPSGLYLRTGFAHPDERSGEMTQYMTDLIPATPGYLSALQVPLLAGRHFDDRDTAAALPVAILSADLARRLFGRDDPIGRTLPIGPENDNGDRAPATIVGVVGNVRYASLAAAPDGAVYRPYQQQPWRTVFLVGRTTEEPSAIAGSLRQAVLQVDRQISVVNVRTMNDVLSAAVAAPRFRTMLLATLAFIGIFLGAVGLYGVMAYSVAQRTREIGIRMALGASPATVLWMTLRESARLVTFGALLGLAAAFIVTRALDGLLYDVSATDTVSFVSAAVGLVIVAALATWVPARRATGVNPIRALRTP